MEGVPRLLRILPAVALTVLLTACSDGTAAPVDEPAPATGDRPRAERPAPDLPTLRYVALGDSYTSAPGLPGSSLPCLRSEENYPALVAEGLADRFDVRLDDRSCVGADTSSLGGAQELGAGRIPPQLDAVDRRTDLVTLSLGGNDDGFFVRLLTGCLDLGGGGTAPCTADALTGGLTEVGQRLVDAVADVRRRAPDARVLLVGYPQLVPDAGDCAELPAADAALAVAGEANRALSATLAGAAATAGVPYVDVAHASQGHELCSDEPWVSGTGSDPSGAIPFHPLPAEQEAVARLVLRRVG